MKKIIALILLALSAIVVFAGCSKNEQVFTQKTYDIEAAQISELNIDVRDRKIEISASTDNQIHIVYSESDKEYYDISLSENNVLKMTDVIDKKWSDFIGKNAKTEDRKITLQIPEAILATVKISTTNEEITASALNVSEDIFLSSNGGNISLEKINAENCIKLNAKNGNINGTIIGGYDDYAIMCEIKKGESNLPSEKADGDKTLYVNVNNGDININFVK